MLSRKSKTILLLVCLLVGTFCLYVFVRRTQPTNVVINEISFSNNDKNDWVEIYNPTLNNISLKGYYLTDTQKEHTRFLIEEDIVVPSRGFAVLYGEKSSDATVPDSHLLNFNITNGETVYLVAPSGEKVIDFLTAISQSTTSAPFTVGRIPDGASEMYILHTPTLADNNTQN